MVVFSFRPLCEKLMPATCISMELAIRSDAQAYSCFVSFVLKAPLTASLVFGQPVVWIRSGLYQSSSFPPDSVCRFYPGKFASCCLPEAGSNSCKNSAIHIGCSRTSNFPLIFSRSACTYRILEHNGSTCVVGKTSTLRAILNKQTSIFSPLRETWER